MNRILIVEDDPSLGRGLVIALTDAETAPTLAASCADARRLLAEQAFDLCIFDVGLPDGSGLDLLTELRQVSVTPVLLLTANDLETDIVTGFTLGADDYITKPFSLAVLRVRVAAQLRRAKSGAPVCRVGEYEFDFDRLTFAHGGKPIALSQTEQKLLKLLVENRGRTLPRDTLIDRIWTDGAAYVDENALSVTVRRLRSKLGDDAPIKTIYGVGYTWAVEA
ncbi:response regulator transcription factor [Agathobaculum sp. NTUH-O15-33]|uniref:response regulator transcription factor n=1 Tax=Agathobaculum sp. NTUH-O15-33 TaxID=3079302 RepID=UPI002958CA6C|nr:response regulator transcription factor [Agathobaculum sp. NTUH-O15-33]WNX84961.1 response regulator transcription factor [Agathobaculum sp. NTUH-O15-33]